LLVNSLWKKSCNLIDFHMGKKSFRKKKSEMFLYLLTNVFSPKFIKETDRLKKETKEVV